MNIVPFIKRKAGWIVLFMLIMLKFAYYGYSYYPVRDDNIAYGAFGFNSNVFTDVFLYYKLYTVRPITGLLDTYFWMKLWGNLGIALFIITLLHFVTCVLIYKVFKANNLNIGLFALIVFALLPLGSEATYWINASTRIIVGLFFTVLSLYLLCLYLGNQNNLKRRYIILGGFSIVNLISLGFYEQLIVLSFSAAMLIIVMNWRKIANKFIVALPVLNLGLIGLWYKAFSGQGMHSSRSSLINADYIDHTAKVASSIFKIWKNTLSEFWNYGFLKGIKVIIGDSNFLFLTAAIAISVLIAIFAARECREKNTKFKLNIVKFTVGVALFILPLVPFFILKDVIFFKRNIFLSFLGLGMILESMINLASRNAVLSVGKGVVVGVITFVFLVGNVYELYYYRQVGIIDYEIAAKISKADGVDEFLRDRKELVLFNSKAKYVEAYTNRSPNCTDADWSLTGLLQAYNKIADLKYNAYPVFDKIKMPMSEERIKSSVLLGIDDARNVFPLKISKENGDKILLSKPDGVEFGEVEMLPDKLIEFRKK